MTTQNILAAIGHFSTADTDLFEGHIIKKTFNKNEVLLAKGEICQTFYFIVSGSFYQSQEKDIDEVMIDLHVDNEWMYNQESLVNQTPSKTSIKAFNRAEVIALSLHHFHFLVSRSPSFLQFNRILNQAKDRTHLFDNALNPSEKYDYIIKTRPRLAKVFPIKMIASYLKIAPETLSRVRAGYRIY